jgi:hypothetical protein
VVVLKRVAVSTGSTHDTRYRAATAKERLRSFTPLSQLRLTPKLRWNAAWQYYGYNEQFQLFSYHENYHAHTGFTSLQWSF